MYIEFISTPTPLKNKLRKAILKGHTSKVNRKIRFKQRRKTEPQTIVSLMLEAKGETLAIRSFVDKKEKRGFSQERESFFSPLLHLKRNFSRWSFSSERNDQWFCLIVYKYHCFFFSLLVMVEILRSHETFKFGQQGGNVVEYKDIDNLSLDNQPLNC